MPLSTLFLILASIALSAGAQVALKFGAISPAVRSSIENTNATAIALAFISSPLIVIGMACFGLSAVTWLFVLSRVPLSTAYPFIALGMVITVFAGYFMLGEALTPYKLCGIALITGGIILIAKGC